MAVTLDEFGDMLGHQPRHGKTQRILQPQADDMARLLLRRHLQPEIAGGEADAFGDAARGIDDGPVPVEDQQPVLHSCSANAAMSPGSLASRRKRSPVSGWTKARRLACRKSRLTPRLARARLSSKSPYLSSPSTGCSACARCTR